jgi:dihydrolipoamide dehydrogenase
MTMQNEYDLVVIGAGPGGYVAAIKAAQLGMKTAVVESREIGGTCLNRGCIPTKTLMHAAEVYREISSCGTLGIHAQGVTFNLEEMFARKDEVVEQLKDGIEQLFKSNKIDSITGIATISGEHEVTVRTAENEKIISAEHILIATGSVPSRPPIEGLNLPGVVTSDELLSMNTKRYRSLVIIGGGVIGMEFATIYNALGCEVTVIEAMDRILPLMDKEISQNLSMIMKKRGVKIFTSATVEKIGGESGLTCYFQNKGETQQVSADGILVAIGRKPNTDQLFGEQFSLACERGGIVVNENYQTSVPSVYAIGDVIRGVQLAHVASAQGINAVAAMQGRPAPVNMAVIPSCVYTSPEIACVGLTSEEAKAKGIAVKTGKFLMSANGKSLITQQERGFIKVVFEEETEVILGAQLMCARATDLISELSTAIANRLTQEQLSGVIRPHPTYSEGITEAVEEAQGTAIHIAPKRK